MKRMNLGCADDIKEGWTNVDSFYRPEFDDIVQIWDARESPPALWVGQYDFILVNHVLCTMVEADVTKILQNIKQSLRVGGKIQVIDVDLLKAFYAYEDGDESKIPIFDAINIDQQLVRHITGYNTRLSLYTPNLLTTLLREVGFKNVEYMVDSEYDTRPDESLVVEGTK